MVRMNALTKNPETFTYQTVTLLAFCCWYQNICQLISGSWKQEDDWDVFGVKGTCLFFQADHLMTFSGRAGQTTEIKYIFIAFCPKLPYINRTKLWINIFRCCISSNSVKRLEHRYEGMCKQFL